MNRKFKHLTEPERAQIQILIKQGYSNRRVATAMGRHHTTISRELKRNTGQRGYRHQQANNKARQRHKDKPKYRKVTTQIHEYIVEGLQQHWSPQQICGRLKLIDGVRIAPETIYRFILKNKKLGGNLFQFLRHQNKPYKKRYGQNDFRGTIPNRTDISERPRVVDTRERLGDWEVDLVIGKGQRGVFVTLAERFSRLFLAFPISCKKKELVSATIVHLLANLKSYVHTLTYDNGREFCDHTEVNDVLESRSYFARPYHSWERGLNENSNGLIRQYFPKDMPLDKVTVREVTKAVIEMNNRPRKCLGYKTPLEVFTRKANMAFRVGRYGALVS